MTSILDSRDKIKELDKSNLLSSVEALPDQILDALEQTKNLVIPEEYRSVKNVVVSGMGGSVLGSYVIKGLFKSELTIPFEVVSHYELPGYVGSDTLVLLASYSGTTEETLSSATEAQEKGAKVMVITAGGPLAELAQKNNWPIYLIKATYNPSNQPRLAIGYAIAGQLALFAKAGILPDQHEALTKVAAGLRTMITRLAPESTDNNTAKLLAYAAFEKHIIISAAEHLVGAAHVFNNQVNENSKALTSEWHLPEFNHHYMEALGFPKANKETTIFFLVTSGLYHARVAKRFPLTQELIESKEYETQLIQATAPTKLEQVFEIIQLGEFVAAYLPLLYRIDDPGPVPNVEWFKSQMAK
jgi:glucose/mannose-6-phosphate isomerase